MLPRTLSWICSGPFKHALRTAERVLKNAILDSLPGTGKKRKELEDRLAREAKEKEEKEKAALLKKSKKALDSGNLEKAVDLEQQSQEHHVAAPTIAPTVQKVAGLSYKTVWKARIIDYKKILRRNALY